MREFVVSPFATEDLNEIWGYVTEQYSEDHADRTLRRLMHAFGDIAEFPGIGHLREDLTSLPLRFHLSRPYLILYDRDTTPISIVAVIHGSRNIAELIRERNSTQRER